MVRAVDHNRGKATVNAGLTDVEICSVVKVKCEVNAAIAVSFGLGGVPEEYSSAVATTTQSGAVAATNAEGNEVLG